MHLHYLLFFVSSKYFNTVTLDLILNYCSICTKHLLVSCDSDLEVTIEPDPRSTKTLPFDFARKYFCWRSHLSSSPPLGSSLPFGFPEFRTSGWRRRRAIAFEPNRGPNSKWNFPEMKNLWAPSPRHREPHWLDWQRRLLMEKNKKASEKFYTSYQFNFKYYF